MQSFPTDASTTPHAPLSATAAHTLLVSIPADDLEPEVDFDRNSGDDDAALVESPIRSAASLRSSIYEHVEENGRTYHAYNSGKYMMPNDEIEQERLDLQHNIFKIMLDGKLHTAPISNTRRVLDLATGTGIWAIEFAQDYPDAVIIGTDLSPIQPQNVPVNCKFEVADAESDWTFDQPFNYIHTRAVLTCFKDNRAVLQKIYDNLAPGGYFELQDPCLPMLCDDGTLEGTALGEWNSLLVTSMSLIGRNIADSQNWGRYMIDAGFVDVTEKRIHVPVNSWPRGKKNKLLGAIALQNMTEGVASLSSAAFTRVLGWDQERLRLFLGDVRKDLKNKEIHAYGIIYFVYGRKPL